MDTPVLYLISGKNHPGFHYVPEGFEHLTSISASLPTLRPCPCHLLQLLNQKMREEVDSKGPFSLVHASYTFVSLLWCSFSLASLLELWLDHHTDSIMTLGNICQFFFPTYFD